MENSKDKLEDFLANANSDVFVALDSIPENVFDYITGASLSMPLLRGHKVRVLLRREGGFDGAQSLAIPFFHINTEFLNGLLRAYGPMEFPSAMRDKVRPEYQRDPRLSMSNLSVYATLNPIKKSYVASDKEGMYLSGLSDDNLSISGFNGSTIKTVKTSFGRLVKNAKLVPSNHLGSAYVKFNAR